MKKINCVNTLPTHPIDGDMYFYNHESYYSWGGCWIKVVSPHFYYYCDFRANLQRLKNKILG